MVTRGASKSEWPTRLALLAIGTAQAGVTVYFSSQAAEVASVRETVETNGREIALIKQRMDLGKATRDGQVAEMQRRLDQIESRRR